MKSAGIVKLVMIATTSTACSVFDREDVKPLEPLPTLPVPQVTTLPIPDNTYSVRGNLNGGQRLITLSAANAKASDLLALLAEAAGASIVLTPELANKTVSVIFQDVPAAVALAKVVETVTGGTAGTVPAAAATPPVFYELPVNVNSAAAQAISIRFRTSTALADWIVASRMK